MEDKLKKIVDKEFKKLEDSWIGRILDKVEDLDIKIEYLEKKIDIFEREIKKEITTQTLLLAKIAELAELKNKK